MKREILVLGAGYAGCAAVKKLEELDTGKTLTWVSENPYHLVKHQVHRVIRRPEAEEAVTIPVDEIKESGTEFIETRVTDIDVDEKTVYTDEEDIEYEVLLVCLGGTTAFYGIPGLEEHGFILNSLEDAVNIRKSIEEACRTEGPAKVVVGGGGLTGIETAGEIAEYRDNQNEDIDIEILEALDEIYAPGDEKVRKLLHKELDKQNIDVSVGDGVEEVTSNEIKLSSGRKVDYDALIWTGGVKGRPTMENVNLEQQHNRVEASSDFTTSARDVFAVGDVGIIDLNGSPAPTTGAAAWKGGELAARNVLHHLNDEPLEKWSYESEGTVISVGDDCIASDIKKFPISTFNGHIAKYLKTFIAMRWIAHITNWRRALKSKDAV